MVLTLLAAPSARAEDGEGRIHLFGHRYSLIAGASVFVPHDKATQSLYGRNTFAPVLTLWSFETPRGVGLSWDLGGQSMPQGDRRADMGHVGGGPRILFADSRADVAPYFAVRAGAYVVRLDRTDWYLKPGVNAELGASLFRHFVVSGRYDLVPKVAGIDLSGFGARVAVKLF